MTDVNFMKLLHHRIMEKKVGTNQAEKNALQLGGKSYHSGKARNIMENRDWEMVKAQMELNMSYLRMEEEKIKKD